MHLKPNKFLGFNDLPLLVLGIPVLGYLIPILFFGMKPTDELFTYRYILGSIAYTFMYWVGSRGIIIHLRKRFPEYRDYKKRVIITAVLVIVFAQVVCDLTEWWVSPMPERQVVDIHYHLTSFSYNIASLISTITIGAIYETIYVIYLMKHVLVESERLKKEHLRSQLETLKNQINPHFLFNSLNTLTAVIHKDPDVSVRFVEELSKVYRYILEIKDKELIALSEELEGIKAYEFLLNIRFGDRFNLTIDIPDEVRNWQVVPLSLQMLVENALKHNVVAQKRPLNVTLSIDEAQNLLVQNNLQPKTEKGPSTKTGLENIKKRYQILTNREVKVIISSTDFCVVLPLLNPEEV